jgi:hypothetical protein
VSRSNEIAAILDLVRSQEMGSVTPVPIVDDAARSQIATQSRRAQKKKDDATNARRGKAIGFEGEAFPDQVVIKQLDAMK